MHLTALNVVVIRHTWSHSRSQSKACRKDRAQVVTGSQGMGKAILTVQSKAAQLTIAVSETEKTMPSSQECVMNAAAAYE